MSKEFEKARDDVVACARRISRLVAEFDGDLAVIDGEYWDALWSAVDRLEAAEDEIFALNHGTPRLRHYDMLTDPNA
jgi:hypothetical protein